MATVGDEKTPRVVNGENSKAREVRMSNIISAISVADAIRTSLGPRGMDKMVVMDKGNAIVSNDGATILKNMSFLHPCARMLVELSNAQDVEAGDGTTTVVIVAGCLLNSAQKLLKIGIHPTIIATSFRQAAYESEKILTDMSIKIDIQDTEILRKLASTSLNSKIIAQHATKAAEIAVDAVRQVRDNNEGQVDLKNIRIMKKRGQTMDQMELVDGLILEQTVYDIAGGPKCVKNAKIALIQFQISAPKTDMDSTIVINDATQMDNVIREEQEYLINVCQKLSETGCNVVLIQKSILRDAVSELAMHFLAKMNIMVIKDIERAEIEFISKTLGCKPIADVNCLARDKLGYADTVEEITSDDIKIVRIHGIASKKTASILIRGANDVILNEVERSLHDALCVVRCLVKKSAYLPGGGAPEMEVAVRLSKQAKTIHGPKAMCFEAYAEAMESVVMILAENTGVPPISILTKLRADHAKGHTMHGINMRIKEAGDMLSENVVQPLLVTSNAINLASETASMILKIDDIVQSR